MKEKFTTTFHAELLKEVKTIAIEYGCNANDVLEACYEYCRRGKKLEDAIRGEER